MVTHGPAHVDEAIRQMKLRWEFVGMLFALTVAKIAENTAPLLFASWSFDPVQATRLLLVGFIVSSSWIGWSVSKAKGAAEEVTRVFSTPFAVLTIDVVLVVLYFKMADGIGRASDVHTLLLPEAFWSAVIFAVYLLWDLVTKVLVHDGSAGPRRMLPTAVCLATTGVILLITAGAVARERHVVVVNIALLLVFVAFRAAKDRPPLSRFLKYGPLAIAVLLATSVRW